MKLSLLLEENKEQEYKKYIEEHINNIKKAWQQVQNKLKGEYEISNELKKKINYLIENHDKSKYSKEEFDGYRQFFYPELGKGKNKEEFNKAWKHHYSVNKHHWQHWIGKKMPLEYIIEQLCDWKAMSIKFNNTPQSYYNKEKERINFTPETRKEVEKWLKIF